MDIKKIVIMSTLFLALSQIPGWAQSRVFVVGGEISFTKKGVIYIQLITKEEFEANKV
jgi:hypothetical protein